MSPALAPLDGSIAVCEICHCVEELAGVWAARHVSWAPPIHNTRWDICVDCCDRYAKCLLGPQRLDQAGDPCFLDFGTADFCESD